MIKKILVSQPKPTSEKSPYYEIASKYGVELVFRPFIKVEGLTAKGIPSTKSFYFGLYCHCLHVKKRYRPFFPAV